MVKLNGLIFKFYNETYRQYVLVTFDAKKFIKLTGGDNLGNAGGCVAIIPGHPLMMWLDMDEDGKIDMTDAAHESFHVADFLLDMVGMEYCHETGNEHMAYLLGWVMGCVLEAQYRQQVNDGILNEDGTPVEESTGFTIIECKDGDDLKAMLEKSSDEWNEKVKLDVRNNDIDECISQLLNKESKM